MSKKRFKDEKSCSNCRNQMTGFDGGFFGLPFTCECRIYGETENRKNCSKFEKKITKSYLLDRIKELEKENEQLRQMIKENVFQRYVEGSLADLEFKAIAYDDIVKVEMSNESEPKVIVSCKQGEKENVKSFCQMFIPFGVYYEIKELEDEWNI